LSEKFLESMKRTQELIEKINNSPLQKSLELSEKLMQPLTHKPKIDVEKAFRNYQLADYQYEILMEAIKEFESELDDNHEVAVQLAAFGQSIVMQVTDIGYSNPALIHFHGYVNGQKSQLIQHVSQLNFLLMAVPKADPGRPARRIGFLPPHDEDSD